MACIIIQVKFRVTTVKSVKLRINSTGKNGISTNMSNPNPQFLHRVVTCICKYERLSKES